MNSKVRLDRIKKEILDINFALQVEHFKKLSFDIKKTKSGSSFSIHDTVVLQSSLPAIIFEAMLFYLLKANEELSSKNQENLQKIFEIAKSKIQKNYDGITKNSNIILKIVNCLKKYENLANFKRNQISSRLFHFDSRTTSHTNCLGGEIPKMNMVIKFRGVQREATHIRIGIKIIDSNDSFEFVLQDIVNKKDRNP